MPNLVYVAEIKEINSIENADKIVQARVDCGEGGVWNGVVQKDSFKLDDKCFVFLQDSILPPSEDYVFLQKGGWRIRMMRLRGCRSEVLILPFDPSKVDTEAEIGTDITEVFGVTKYSKELPTNIGGDPKGYFPSFIPKTDEVNFQKVGKMIRFIRENKIPVYVTQKQDGSSVTYFNHEGEFSACSRNLELKFDDASTIWNVARLHDLANKMTGSEYAIQCEIIGPGIQKNPVGLEEVDIRIFNVYDIVNHKYLDYADVVSYCRYLEVEMVPVLDVNIYLPETDDELVRMAEGKYQNGKQQEGIVIRPLQETDFYGERMSFKVINLLYKD